MVGRGVKSYIAEVPRLIGDAGDRLAIHGIAQDKAVLGGVCGEPRIDTLVAFAVVDIHGKAKLVLAGTRLRHPARSLGARIHLAPPIGHVGSGLILHGLLLFRTRSKARAHIGVVSSRFAGGKKRPQRMLYPRVHALAAIDRDGID